MKVRQYYNILLLLGWTLTTMPSLLANTPSESIQTSCPEALRKLLIPSNSRESLQETAKELLSKHFKSYKVKKSYFRGFAQKDYGAVQFVKSLAGDKGLSLRSWDLKRKIAANIAIGLTEDMASARAEQEMIQQIKNQVFLDPRMYVHQQSQSTFPGVPERSKSGSAVPFSRSLRDSTIKYARDNAERLLGENPGNYRKIQAIIIEIDQSVPQGVPDLPEHYYVLSHVEPRDFRSAYMGFPKAGSYNTENRQHMMDWFHLVVTKRSQNGAVSGLRLEQVEEIREQGFSKPGRALVEITREQKLSTQEFNRLRAEFPQMSDVLTELFKFPW